MSVAVGNTFQDVLGSQRSSITAYVAGNVSTVSPAFAITTGGTSIALAGSGFTGQTIHCTVSGATMAESWVYAKAVLESAPTSSTSSVLRCSLPARAAGFHVTEVAMSNGGEMSHYGVQAEFVSAPTVASVYPSVGSSEGGTVITLAGSEFVPGRVACKFGSAMVVNAQVVSSTEAICVTPAGARGSVTMETAIVSDGVEVSMMASAMHVLYNYKAPLVATAVTPTQVQQQGGNKLSISTVNKVDSDNLACLFNGNIVVDAVLSSPTVSVLVGGNCNGE
jgi:hypothetical protein